jgi:tetratricopeptide (TPR) repeat protein
MKDPTLNLEQVFKRVRTEVTEKSSGAQVPWETTSLTGGDFFLTTKESNAALEAKPVNASKGNLAVTSELDPEKAIQFYTQAQEKYDNGKFKEAIDLYTKAIEANPDDASSYLWRGHARYSWGYENGIVNSKLLEESITDYTKTLQLSPGDAEAYYFRANAKKLLNRLKEAIPDFTLSIKYDPKRKEIFYFRGLTYYLLGNNAAALEDFERSIEQDPEHASSYLLKAHATFGLEN